MEPTMNNKDILPLMEKVGDYVDLMDNILHLENEGRSNLYIVNASRKLENQIVAGIGQVISGISDAGNKKFIIGQLHFIDDIIEKYHCTIKSAEDFADFTLKLSHPSIVALNEEPFESIEDLPEELFQLALTLRYILDQVIGKYNKAFKGVELSDCYLVYLKENKDEK